MTGKCSNGSRTEPSLESGFTETGERTDPETEFRESKGERAFETLLQLRGQLCAILEKFRIQVIPPEECRKGVPWLRAGEEVLVAAQGEPIRVLDALFFEAL